MLDALRRTRSGDFGLDDAVRYDELVTSARESLLSRLVPFDRLLSDRPSVTLDATGGGPRASWPGRRPVFDVADVGRTHPETSFASLDEEGRLIALAKAAGEPGFLHAPVVFG